MNRSMKAIAAIMLMTAAVVVAGCKDPVEPSNDNDVTIKVTTIAPTNIKINEATCGAEVVVNDLSGLKELGVCWGTTANPTIDNSHLGTTAFDAPFVCTIHDLDAATHYHVRAYVLSGTDCLYGDDKSFTTLSEGGMPVDPTLPYVITLLVEDVTDNSAHCGGVVESDGGAEVTERGLCWGVNHNPTLDDFHASSGTGIGTFTVEMTGLSAGVPYYVRAYAINSIGISYSEVEYSFTTGGLNIPEGAINGMFTINRYGEKVYFSKGNLQYIGNTTTPYWKFADKQWEYFYMSTGQEHVTPYADRDCFGWGTSGYHDESDPFNVQYYPYSVGFDSVDAKYNYYGFGPSTNMPNPNLNGSNYDWGVFNPISNGGNVAGLWRTLTMDEWMYLLDWRNTTSGIRFAKANVANVNGLLLLPDDWNHYDFYLTEVNTTSASFYSNLIEEWQWPELEAAGAVFLPAAGIAIGLFHDEVTFADGGVYGCYWTSTSANSSYAGGIEFNNNTVEYYMFLRCQGLCVRLVSNVE